ncbi:MAG: Uncharacterised protein [Cryomorphaceae bacterium]|nr:MAG: Uncharacterised protein [Cryomorphaceae bacterium]
MTWSMIISKNKLAKIEEEEEEEGVLLEKNEGEGEA